MTAGTNISFDYDNTLICYKYVYDEDGNPIDAVYTEPHDLPVRKIFYTSNRCKMDVLRDNGVTVHFDDCPEQCDRIMDEWAQNCSGPISVLVDAPDGINDFLKEKFSKIIGDLYERES